MSAGASNARSPHAVLDLDSRRLKALKIERLLDLRARRQPVRMLEIGTGSGGIAHYFATGSDLHIEVDAVDIVDNRLVSDGYRFQLVHDTRLPFADECFDVVLTNHVIEHVGARAAQLHHLQEVRRVLKRDGIGYLAVPNRWRLVEPHYRLAFLSWLPHGWRSAYLKWRRGIDFYDCEPLDAREAATLLSEAGFQHEELYCASIRATVSIEHPNSLAGWLLERLPDWPLRVFRPIVPTLIYRFRHPAE